MAFARLIRAERARLAIRQTSAPRQSCRPATRRSVRQPPSARQLALARRVSCRRQSRLISKGNLAKGSFRLKITGKNLFTKKGRFIPKKHFRFQKFGPGKKDFQNYE